MKIKAPFARFENIVVQELKDEILICDTKNNQVFCLNSTAGEVWKLCDGHTEVKAMAQILSRKLKANVSEEMILFSLTELAKHNLLIKKSYVEDSFSGFSRREVIKRIGLGSMIALPLISSVVMPRAIHAASSCIDDSECVSGECCNTLNNACVTSGENGCVCTRNRNCNSSCCTVNTGVCSDPTFDTCGGGVDCPAPYICCNNFNTGSIGSFRCSCDGFC